MERLSCWRRKSADALRFQKNVTAHLKIALPKRRNTRNVLSRKKNNGLQSSRRFGTNWLPSLNKLSRGTDNCQRKSQRWSNCRLSNSSAYVTRRRRFLLTKQPCKPLKWKPLSARMRKIST